MPRAKAAKSVERQGEYEGHQQEVILHWQRLVKHGNGPARAEAVKALGTMAASPAAGHASSPGDLDAIDREWRSKVAAVMSRRRGQPELFPARRWLLVQALALTEVRGITFHAAATEVVEDARRENDAAMAAGLPAPWPVPGRAAPALCADGQDLGVKVLERDRLRYGAAVQRSFRYRYALADARLEGEAERRRAAGTMDSMTGPRQPDK